MVHNIIVLYRCGKHTSTIVKFTNTDALSGFFSQRTCSIKYNIIARLSRYVECTHPVTKPTCMRIPIRLLIQRTRYLPEHYINLYSTSGIPIYHSW